MGCYYLVVVETNKLPQEQNHHQGFTLRRGSVMMGCYYLGVMETNKLSQEET